jgi:2-succinyl-5-enolpyruvyl-6-hydroxy-3-cyclohexene-1-carboxylate synthase
VPQPGGLPVDPGWLAAWQQRGAAAREAVEQVLDAAGPLAEPRVAHAVLEAAARDGATLVVGSSTPVRDLLLWGPRDGVRVLANRGAAGIDGTVSTAIGVALAAGPTFALLGDSLPARRERPGAGAPTSQRPDLTIVVTIQRRRRHLGRRAGAPRLERVFGNPHGVDLAAPCAGHRGRRTARRGTE